MCHAAWMEMWIKRQIVRIVLQGPDRMNTRRQPVGILFVQCVHVHAFPNLFQRRLLWYLRANLRPNHRRNWLPRPRDNSLHMKFVKSPTHEVRHCPAPSIRIGINDLLTPDQPFCSGVAPSPARFNLHAGSSACLHPKPQAYSLLAPAPPQCTENILLMTSVWPKTLRSLFSKST